MDRGKGAWRDGRRRKERRGRIEGWKEKNARWNVLGVGKEGDELKNGVYGRMEEGKEDKEG